MWPHFRAHKAPYHLYIPFVCSTEGFHSGYVTTSKAVIGECTAAVPHHALKPLSHELHHVRDYHQLDKWIWIWLADANRMVPLKAGMIKLSFDGCIYVPTLLQRGGLALRPRALVRDTFILHPISKDTCDKEIQITFWIVHDPKEWRSRLFRAVCEEGACVMR